MGTGRKLKPRRGRGYSAADDRGVEHRLPWLPRERMRRHFGRPLHREIEVREYRARGVLGYTNHRVLLVGTGLLCVAMLSAVIPVVGQALALLIGGVGLGLLLVLAVTGRPVSVAIGVLLEHRRCPACLYELTGIPPEEDGCVVCPECAAAWRPEDPAACAACGYGLAGLSPDERGVYVCPECGGDSADPWRAG